VRILYVEDNDDNIYVLQKRLTRDECVLPPTALS